MKGVSTRESWLVLRLKFFGAGVGMGLFTFVPAQALIGFLAPGYILNMDDPTSMLRWFGFCGVLCVLFTMSKKDTTFG